MPQYDTQSQEASDSARNGVKPNSLTQFREDLLAILADEARYGLAVMRELEEYYDEEITHARLYTNLDRLVEEGLAEKTPIDRRSYEYSITSEGREWLRARVEWRANRLGYILEEER